MVKRKIKKQTDNTHIFMEFYYFYIWFVLTNFAIIIFDTNCELISLQKH